MCTKISGMCTKISDTRQLSDNAQISTQISGIHKYLACVPKYLACTEYLFLALFLGASQSARGTYPAHAGNNTNPNHANRQPQVRWSDARDNSTIASEYLTLSSHFFRHHTQANFWVEYRPDCFFLHFISRNEYRKHIFSAFFLSAHCCRSL